MSEQEPTGPDGSLGARIKELSVHIPCGGIRGPSPRWRWQSCRCEEHPQKWQGHDVSRATDLCIVCFRGTAGGPSRWSWLACLNCRRVNTAIERRSGVRPFNLGRHSLMNGIGIRGGQPPEVREEQIGKLVAFARGDDRLRTWPDTEYRRLAAVFDPLADIPLPVWQQQWVPGLDASVDAFSRLLGLELSLYRQAE